MHPALTTAGGAAIAAGALALARESAAPLAPEQIAGALWYRTHIERLRVTSGRLLAATAEDVYQLQLRGARELYPGGAMPDGELAAVLRTWIAANDLTVATVGATPGAPHVAALRDRLAVHEFGTVGRTAVDATVATWSAIGHHARQLDALRDHTSISEQWQGASGTASPGTELPWYAPDLEKLRAAHRKALGTLLGGAADVAGAVGGEIRDAAADVFEDVAPEIDWWKIGAGAAAVVVGAVLVARWAS